MTSDNGDAAFCDWGWDGLPPIRVVKIVSLGIEYELPKSVDDQECAGVEGGKRAGERAMELAGLL